MNEGKPSYILDSFALLAFLEGEPATIPLRAILQRAQRGAIQVHLPLINLGEVLYITEREHGLTLAHQALSAIEQLPIMLLEATRERILAAAHIKANYRLSYTDAFPVAAALELNGTILTGAPEFEAVKAIVQIEWLPRR